MRTSLRLGLIAFVLLTGVRTASGQRTNVEVLSAMSVACVAPPTEDLVALRFAGPSRLPFLRSAMVAAWQATGRTVFEATAEPDPSAPVVRVDLEDAGVSYASAPDDRIARTVHLRLRMTVTEPGGRIAFDDSCSRNEEDLVPRSALASIEDSAWPETRADHPDRGWLHRLVRPAVIGVASAVGVFLFFSLRSRRSADDG